jgi:Rrf2 family iron-sulfur cluster assembly transcriptional regulator
VQVTRQVDYAMRAVLYLAECEPGTRVPTAAIGRAQQIPLTFLAKIVTQLADAGIVEARRGGHGGVSLGRPADEINLLDVVTAIARPLMFNRCLTGDAGCPLGERCAISGVWCEVQASVVEHLRSATFARLVEARRLPPAP